MGVYWTRRALVTSACSSLTALAAKDTFASERSRFIDGATENVVFRLTDPVHNCFLPPPQNRSCSSRNGFLVYVSDRTGSLQVYRMDQRSGESELLSEISGLDASSVTLTPNDKSLCLFAGDMLWSISASNPKSREIYRAGGERAPGVSISSDSNSAALIVRRQTSAHLMLASLNKGGAQKLTDLPLNAEQPLIRPRSRMILYQVGTDSLWLTEGNGSPGRQLPTAPGPLRSAQWSPDGATILYLAGNELRELTPEGNVDALVARTSQFVAFNRNGDASVFVGASGSKAGPYVILLLRISRREMAICEHRAKNPMAVNPVFAPSSQRIFFQSDRTGKSALYSMIVDRLVEETGT